MQQDHHLSPIWELRPLEGLGTLRFSTHRSAVSAYEQQLGAVTYTRDEGMAQKKQELVDSFAQMPGLFTEDEIQSMLQTLDEVGSDLDDMVTVYHESGISLQYQADALTEIFADDRVSKLHFQGLPIFSSDPLALVKQMSTAFGENPILQGEELIFVQQHIYLFSFLREAKDGSYAVGAAKERTILWRNSPRPHGVPLDDYKAIQLI